ncbi:hypothetical protein CHUAL_011304 [Chamberlinius hualienensis]
MICSRFRIEKKNKVIKVKHFRLLRLAPVYDTLLKEQYFSRHHLNPTWITNGISGFNTWDLTANERPGSIVRLPDDLERLDLFSGHGMDLFSGHGICLFNKFTTAAGHCSRLVSEIFTLVRVTAAIVIFSFPIINCN